MSKTRAEIIDQINTFFTHKENMLLLKWLVDNKINIHYHGDGARINIDLLSDVIFEKFENYAKDLLNPILNEFRVESEC
jgi:hypothetical protein